MENQKTIIIAGGGYAGILAANRLARKKLPLKLILITDKPNFQERIRNHQLLAGNLKKEYPISDLLHKKITLKLGKIDKINGDKKEILLENKETLSYDYLIYALGVQKLPSNPDLPNYISIAEVEDCRKMNQVLRQISKPKITIIGAGLSGIETVAELAETFPHSELSIIENGKLGSGFSDAARNWMIDHLTKNQVNILEDTKVTSFSEGSIHTSAGFQLKHDICIFSNGLQASPVGSASSLPVNPKGQILVNEFLGCKSHPEIIGAGDGIQVDSPSGSHLRMACASAMPMGIYAAERLSFLLGAKSKLGEKPFSLAYLGRNVSLGRKDGVVQSSLRDDTPIGIVWKAKAAARIKETICKLTIFSMKMEKYFNFYLWKA
ncbi:NAD(P)/FAD-dependent oxidoreductase [Leptospira idonii]|uniref:NADH dehydrogenase FAD-containing subunit n=1 Tax=Leptospira idonii TaxID=1193500 RepID=A0A4V3JY46_9LEPT|nr:FAD-dependent oxidoreductase [Leptospira idonii]TGN19016.1 NADH dehydrogenase FAD-containing subunit [Leptospira idonii]